MILAFFLNEADQVLERHLKLYEKLENEFIAQENTIGALVANSGGFQVASIKNIGMIFFISDKAELLDFDLISQVLDIELKTNLLSKNKRFSESVKPHSVPTARWHCFNCFFSPEKVPD